ncbi:MAG: helix-turn-helix transcriptional regulator [Halobacteriota archaeon]
MNPDRGIDLAETAAVHHETLTALREEQLNSHQLERTLECSRATINRHLATLRERELVTRVDGEHALTEFGATVLRELEDVYQQLDVSAQVPKLVEGLQDSPIQFSLRMLTGATVTSATSDEPYEMHDRYLGFWEETDRVHGARSIAAVPPDVVEHVRSRLRDGLEVESVWTSAAARQYLDTYPEVASAWIDEPNARLLVTDEPIPVQFGVFDQCLTFTVHDNETGHPRALVDTAEPAALEWGRDLYEYYAERSQSLEAWMDASTRD